MGLGVRSACSATVGWGEHGFLIGWTGFDPCRKRQQPDG
jgi:hypothetical protein